MTAYLQLRSIAVIIGVLLALLPVAAAPKAPLAKAQSALRLLSREVSTNQPPFYAAVYTRTKGTRLLAPSRISDDNGRTWKTLPFKPDLKEELPFGFRRNPVTSVCDSRTGRFITVLNALDTPGLDPKISEPRIAQNTYYLRYRVSKDGGQTWLFDDPIVQAGSFDSNHPFEGVWVGKNAIYLGDAGSIPIVTDKGHVLVPAQMTPLAPDGSLFNPSGGHTFTDVLILIGSWTKTGRLKWDISEPLRGDPSRTTRGLIEPTLAQFQDGRILAVMRGSNGGTADPEHNLPSYKWHAVSTDGGHTWTKPEPWTCDDGKPFFSPSSMSTLFKHSSGRCFWVGNLTPVNCTGNLPRWPLVIGEVDSRTLRLIRRSILLVDTETDADKSQGRLDISHVTLLEDRSTRELILCYPRAHHAYKSREWVTARLALTPP